MSAALLEHLLKGRQGRAAVSPVGELAPDLTLEQAYALQRQLEQALVGRGDRVVGYKVGFTTAALQERHGVTEPVLGFMLASGVFGSGDAVPLARFEQDGQIVATQTAAEVLGNPLVSLAWAANTLGQMGRGLRAGDIVLTGSISKVLRPTAGQSVRAAFTRLGSVGCRFA